MPGIMKLKKVAKAQLKGCRAIDDDAKGLQWKVLE
jgi:hypothetical protein